MIFEILLLSLAIVGIWIALDSEPRRPDYIILHQKDRPQKLFSSETKSRPTEPTKEMSEKGIQTMQCIPIVHKL